MDVFFDNLQVSHTRGKILEENHYYPFGLLQQGISSKALTGFAENKYKYNGIEYNNDLDLNSYDAFYRNLDPQIGRWKQIDSKSEERLSWTPYNSMRNNPISNIDPLGDLDDDYKLTKNGNIELVRKTNDNFDRLYATNKEGEILKNKSITLDKEILNSKVTNSFVSEGKIYTYDIYKIDNQKLGANSNTFFEFAANNSNVEWSILKFNLSYGTDIVATTHNKTAEAGALAYLRGTARLDKYSSLLEFSHSHPCLLYTSPSPRD